MYRDKGCLRFPSALVGSRRHVFSSFDDNACYINRSPAPSSAILAGMRKFVVNDPNFEGSILRAY
jgi:hypothetical protein